MNDIFAMFFTAGFVGLVIRVGTPLLFASMSAYIASLAGIPNIAVDGIMIFGALFGVYFSAITQSAFLGLLGAIAVGALFGLVLSFFSMKMKANPIMVGIALNLFATDFSVWLLLIWTGSKGTTASLPSKVLPTVHIPFVENIPILNEIISGQYLLTYVCLAIAVLLGIMVYKTPLGLRMKACGLDEKAARSVGVKVEQVRLIAAVISGILAAMGGAFLSMGYLSIFSNNMTASRGWIGIAASAVGQGNFFIMIIMTIIFSIAQAIVAKLAIFSLPSELINTIPYICVLLGLIGLSIKKYLKEKGETHA